MQDYLSQPLAKRLALLKTKPDARKYPAAYGYLDTNEQTGIVRDKDGTAHTSNIGGLRLRFVDAEQLAGSWRRVPSVTTGGKSFFWLGKFPGRTVALVWDRSAEGWRMHYGPNFDLRGGEVFPGIAEAKRDAQQFALGYPLQPYERA